MAQMLLNSTAWAATGDATPDLYSSAVASPRTHLGRDCAKPTPPTNKTNLPGSAGRCGRRCEAATGAAGVPGTSQAGASAIYPPEPQPHPQRLPPQLQPCGATAVEDMALVQAPLLALQPAVQQWQGNQSVLAGVSWLWTGPSQCGLAAAAVALRSIKGTS